MQRYRLHPHSDVHQERTIDTSSIPSSDTSQDAGNEIGRVIYDGSLEQHQRCQSPGRVPLSDMSTLQSSDLRRATLSTETRGVHAVHTRIRLPARV